MNWLRGLLGQTFINFFHLCQAALANFIYGFPSRKLRVIGVTGTDGKTTTVNFIASILKTAGKKVSSLSSINARIGEQEFDTGLHTTTPSSFFLQKILRKIAKDGSEFVVLEVTSHALDQHRTWGIKFETGVLTNITPEHLDYHKTFDEYAKVKMRLFENVKYRILNIDFSTSPRFATLPRPGEGRERSNHVITYGLDSKASVWAEDIKEDLKSTSFDAYFQNSRYKIQLHLPGRVNVLNALAAICVGQVYKIQPRDIIAGLQKVSSVPGRMEFVEEGQNFFAMVDFAHTPNALENLLKFLQLKITGRLILVFGSAGLRDVQKRSKMGEVADKFADLIILTREDNRSESAEKICQDIASGIKGKQSGRDVVVITNRRQAVKFALSKAQKNDIVVITGKGHEQSLNVDGKETPWDDRTVMREEIKALPARNR